MKVSIAIVAVTLMVAVMQTSVVAGQSAKQGKPSGKTQTKKPTEKSSSPTTSKKPAQKITPSNAANGQTVKPKEKLVARETLIGTGDVLPAYSVTKYSDGKLIELSTLVTGQAVVVLYHPGSKPAMRALTQIAAAAAKAKPGIKVYALCVRTDEASWKVSQKGLAVTMIALWDPAGRTETGMNARKVLGCDAYPTVIVTGSDGKVRDAFAGWFSGDRRLAPLLSE
jgi:hypothetical protein